MVLRSRSKRSLLALAVTAAPLSAQALPAVQLPTFSCDANGALGSINWGDKIFLSGNGAGIAATVATPNAAAAVPGELVPAVQHAFACGDKLFSTGLVAGSDFAINFGSLLGVDPAWKFDLKIDSFGYKIEDKTTPLGKEQLVVSDFDLFIDKLNADGLVMDKYFVGVQVISPFGSALSPDNSYKEDVAGNLVFDPILPGGEAVINLLNAPDSVPEPASLGLLGAGLAAIAVRLRRRRNRE